MRKPFKHAMTAGEYEAAVRERFVQLYPEPEFRVIGGSKCFRPGRLSKVRRQIDVGVVRNSAPDDLVLLADAKRHDTRLDINTIEAFLGYLEDIGCPKGVLASLLGGSGAAVRRAAAGRADLHVVSYAEALSFDWRRVAAGLYPWDEYGHPVMAEALRLLNRGKTEECVEAVEDLPFEEWEALFNHAPASVRAAAGQVLIAMAESHPDDSRRYNALRLLDGVYGSPPAEWLEGLLGREADQETRELLERMLGRQ